VVAVLNAVDLARFAPDGPRADLDALSGLAPPPARVVRVGLIATLAWWKGHAVFLAAIARLPRGLPVRAYVVGGPVYGTRGSQQTLDALRTRAGELGIADRVGFTGFVADSASVMRALDVVVHASTEPEPFGLVIAEAMAAGRPVLVSAAGGAAELVRDGATALTYVPGDVAALAACLERVVGDEALRDRLGREAHAEASRRFSRTRMAHELADVYRAIAPDARAFAGSRVAPPSATPIAGTR
jgi:glycosyltransferase involved in cell wall biosynthesis